MIIKGKVRNKPSGRYTRLNHNLALLHFKNKTDEKVKNTDIKTGQKDLSVKNQKPKKNKIHTLREIKPRYRIRMKLRKSQEPKMTDRGPYNSDLDHFRHSSVSRNMEKNNERPNILIESLDRDKSCIKM